MVPASTSGSAPPVRTGPDPDRGPDLHEVGSLPPLTVEGRVARLRARLADEGIDAFATVDPVSRRWLSGFTGSSGLLLVADRVTLFTDGRYGEQARAELARAFSSAGVAVVSDPVAAAAESVTGGRLALEADRITWAEQGRFAEACRADLVAWTGVVDEMRAVKSPAEVARMAAAAAIATDALAEVLDEGVEGRTEREIAADLDAAMARRGADGPAYDTIVASGPNAARPHARPSGRRVGRGETLVVDVGAVVDGYRSDMTRTLVVGGPRGRIAEIVEAVDAARAAGVATVRAGVQAGEVDAACRGVLADAGLERYFVHGTGHGVGLEIHELPRVRRGSTAILRPGHVVTVEPGVYVEGLGGVRIEDLVLVTDRGCRILTHHPRHATI